MNSALELHDSNISEIRQQGNDVLVLFSHAYIHKSTGRPGWDAGSGWSQAIELVVINSMLPPTLPDNLSDLRGGHLKVNDELFAGLIPMPFNAIGKTELRLNSVKAKGFRLLAKALHCFSAVKGSILRSLRQLLKSIE